MESKRGKSKKELAQEFVINIDFKPEQKKPRASRDTKILAFFAEKGGVGKTTLCTNLAFTFAEKGKRVLIYDCDVQRSLTAWVFGNNIEVYHENHTNKLDNFIKSISNNIDKDKFSLSLADQVIDENSDLKPAFAAKLHNNLYVVVGSRKLIDLEEQISHTEGFCNAFSTPKLNMPKMPNQVSGKIYHSIMKTAEYYDIDYVFVDMNPYPGSFVRCLLMSSHYVIIPSCLDYFCLEMMHNMADNFTRWEKATRKNAEFTKLPGGNYPWPDHFPKFLGFILNIFSNCANLTENDDLVAMQDDVYWATGQTKSVIQTKMYNNELFWKEQIEKEAQKLTEKLTMYFNKKPRDTLLGLTNQQYKDSGLTNKLGEVQEFHTLGVLANIIHTPVPLIMDSMFYKRDNKDGLLYPVKESEKNKLSMQRNKFRLIFKTIADNIIKLIDYDSNSELIMIDD